ncbi:MAG: hypothetical protein AAF329_27715 [Cyanobacteria bacterium P01_A01_bin.17]
MDFLIAPLFILALLTLVGSSNKSDSDDKASQDEEKESTINLQFSAKDLELLTQQLSKSSAGK